MSAASSSIRCSGGPLAKPSTRDSNQPSISLIWLDWDTRPWLISALTSIRARCSAPIAIFTGLRTPAAEVAASSSR